MPLTDVKAAVQEAEQVLEPKLVADVGKLEKDVAADLKAVGDHFLEGLKKLLDGLTITVTVGRK